MAFTKKEFCKNGHLLAETRIKYGDGFRCGVCTKERHRKWQINNRDRQRELDRKYRESLTPEEKEKRYAQMRAARQVWRDKGGHRRFLYKQHGITEDEYNKLFNLYDGKCHVCLQEETGRHNRTGGKLHLAIDHNHSTGKVRGLLCRNCNTALGLMKESPDRLKSLISYIEKYNNEV